MKFICDCTGLRFKTLDDLIKHVEEEHRQPKERKEEG